MNKNLYKFRKKIFFVVILIFGIILGYKFFDYKFGDYILKVGKRYVYKNEFLLYYNEQQRVFEEIGGVDIWETDFDGVDAKEVAKNNTISSIVIVKAVNIKAKELGIKLSNDEIKYSKDEAKILKQKMDKIYGKNFSIKTCEKFIKENLIEGKVYKYITNSFVVDKKDFLKYLEQYKEKNEKSLYKIKLDYIFIKNNQKFNSKDKADEIIKNITYETNFKNYEAENIQVKTNIDLKKDSFEPNIQDKIYNLSEKSVSNLIEGTDGFYIFKIDEKLPLSSQSIEEEAKKEYIALKKEEIYTNQIEIWLSTIKVKKSSKNLVDI